MLIYKLIFASEIPDRPRLFLLILASTFSDYGRSQPTLGTECACNLPSGQRVFPFLISLPTDKVTTLPHQTLGPPLLLQLRTNSAHCCLAWPVVQKANYPKVVQGLFQFPPSTDAVRNHSQLSKQSFYAHALKCSYLHQSNLIPTALSFMDSSKFLIH